MQTEGFLPSNAFSSLIIGGLLKLDGVHVPLTLSKGVSNPPKTLIVKERFARVGGLPPVRPPSKLPPPGKLLLHVSLEPEQLGYGRVGSVYPVIMGGGNEYALPSLVIKVAARRRSEDLAREAWFYEEMEDIQGVAIARCYGLFTAEIDPNSEVLSWAESDAEYEEEGVDQGDVDKSGGEIGGKKSVDESEGEVGESEGGVNESQGEIADYSNDEWNPESFTEYLDEDATKELSWEIAFKRIEENEKLRHHMKKGKKDSIVRSTHTVRPSAIHDSRTTFLSVLVLERLGGLMPMYISLDSIKSDVSEIYSDMGRFGVEHMDIRWRNILGAPATHDSLVCPYHGHKHHWRVVDFDRSRKSNYQHSRIERAVGSRLRSLFGGLSEGHVVEPWG